MIGPRRPPGRLLRRLRRPSGRPWHRLLLALAVVELAYLAAANLFLNTAIGPRLVSRKPQVLVADWDGGWSLLPGQFAVHGLTLHGDHRKARWWLELDRGSGVFNLAALATKSISIHRVRAHGLRLRVERKPPDRPPKTGLGWRTNLEGFRVTEVRDLAILGVRLLGHGAAAGSFHYRVRDALGVGRSWLTLRSAELVIEEPAAARSSTGSSSGRAPEIVGYDRPLPAAAGRSVAEQRRSGSRRVAAGLDLDLEDFRVEGLDLGGRKPPANGEARSRDREEAAEAFSGRARVAAHEVDVAVFNRFLTAAPWLRLAGRGRLRADLELERGRLAPGSEAELSSPAIEVAVLDFVARGPAEAAAEVTAAPAVGGEPIGRAEIAISTFEVPGASAEEGGGGVEAHLRGEGFTVRLTSSDLEPIGPFGDLAAVVELPAAEILDLTYYNRYLPPDLAFAIDSGHGTLGARFELSAADETARGTVDLVSEELVARFDDLRLGGRLALHSELASTDLEARRFDVAGSRVELTGVTVAGGDPEAAGWWGTAEVETGSVVWRQPLTLDLSAAIELRDTRPVVALFAERNRLIALFDRLLTVEDVSADAELHLDGERLLLDPLTARGADLELASHLLFAPGGRRGLLYVRLGKLSVAVAFDGDEREIDLVGSRRWYERRRAELGGSRGTPPR